MCSCFSLRCLPNDHISFGRVCDSCIAAIVFVFPSQSKVLQKKKKGNGPHLPTASLSLFLKPKYSFYVVVYESLNFPLLPFARFPSFCCLSFFGAGQIRLPTSLFLQDSLRL